MFTIPTPAVAGGLALVAGFVYAADFSRRGTSKDTGALTAVPTVFFQFVAVVTTAVAAAAVVAASGMSVVSGVSAVMTMLAACLAAAALLMYRSRMAATVLFVFAVMLARHGNLTNALTVSTETVAVVGMVFSGLLSRFRASVDPIAAAVVMAAAAALISGDSNALSSWQAVTNTVATPAAVALAVVESQRVWAGGLLGVANVAALALPAVARATGFAVPLLGVSSCAVAHAGEVLAAATLALHVAGVRRVLAPSASPAASPRAGPSKSLLRWVPVVVALVAAGSATELRVPLLAAAALLAMLAHFASRSAPLLAPVDVDARASAVFAASVVLLARTDVLDAYSAGFAAALAFAAATTAWALMQLALERDGPFFSNGVRSMLVDLVAIAAVLATGVVVLATYTDVASLPGLTEAYALLAGAWKFAAAAATAAVNAASCTVEAPKLSAPSASQLAVILVVGADLLRAAIQRSSVPLPAHLSGEVLMSGKGMRPSFSITIDGVPDIRAGIVALSASSWKAGESSPFGPLADADGDGAAHGPAEIVVDEADDEAEYSGADAEEDDDEDEADAERSPVVIFVTPAQAASESEGVDAAASTSCEVGLLIPDALADTASEEAFARAKARVEEASGRPCRWARTADGSADCGVVRAAAAAGMTLVLWSAWPRSDFVHSDDAGQHVAEESSGFGKARGGRGAIVRVVSPPSVGDDVNVDDILSFSRVVHAAYSRFATQGLELEALADVVPHRGFELEA